MSETLTIKIDRDIVEKIQNKIQNKKPNRKFNTKAAAIKEVLFEFLEEGKIENGE
jgi:hypothetical protein